MLRFVIANVGKCLSFPACIVAAPFAEDDVSNLHLMMGPVDAHDVDFGGVGGGVDSGASKLVDDLVAAVSLFATAPFSFLHWPAATGSAMLDPFCIHLAFEDFDFGRYLLVLLLACNPSPFCQVVFQVLRIH